MIHVDRLAKRFGNVFSLSVPHFDVGHGETLGLVGNNGAGKTTFLRLILDLLRPDEGHVEIGGEDVSRSPAWKTWTGAYLDESFLLDFLTADEFFDFIGSLYGLGKEGVQHALDPYRSFFTDRVLNEPGKYLRDLSKGNAKKVGLVAAMFIQPKLLILDEPFANLDPGSQIQLKLMLSQLNSTHGTTLIISSHDLIHVTEICNRIALLDDGCIVQDTPTAETTREELELFFATKMG